MPRLNRQDVDRRWAMARGSPPCLNLDDVLNLNGMLARDRSRGRCGGNRRRGGLNMLRGCLLTCLVVVAPASGTLADGLQSGSSRAVLATPVSRPLRGVIDGRFWQCQETICLAAANGGQGPQQVVNECMHAAAKLGRFTGYATGQHTLSDDELATCNTKATSAASHIPH